MSLMLLSSVARIINWTRKDEETNGQDKSCDLAGPLHSDTSSGV
jgi:hypothetical protein